MDFTNLTEHFVLVVVVACLILGYIIKKWIKDVNNKYIPTILAVVGLVLNGFIGGWSIESAVYGALMGLASTGMHQAFTRFIENETE